MKLSLLLSLGLAPVLAVATLGCSTNPAIPPHTHNADPIVLHPPSVDPSDVENAVPSDHAFAVGLYRALGKESGNLFFSPASARMALGMTYLGARGETAKEMAAALHLDADQPKSAAVLAALLYEWNAANDGKLELSVANRLWGAKGLRFRDDFLSLVHEAYGAPLQELDFTNAGPASVATINDWVRDRTHQRIDKLLSDDAVGPATRLVLTNAIYFHGQWVSSFPKSQTERAPFHLTTSRDADVDMMSQESSFSYADVPGAKVISMPYLGSGGFSMMVVLPSDIDGLGALEQSLTAESLAAWSAKLHPEMVSLKLPRFSSKKTMDLVAPLAGMGMKTAFSSMADFSGMDGGRDISIGAVVQKAVVEVTEEGTVAAAATGVIMTTSAMPPPPASFVADHPFLYVLRDRHGDVVFMGRMADPSS